MDENFTTKSPASEACKDTKVREVLISGQAQIHEVDEGKHFMMKDLFNKLCVLEA